MLLHYVMGHTGVHSSGTEEGRSRPKTETSNLGKNAKYLSAANNTIACRK